MKVMKETGKMERDNTSIFLAPNCHVSSQRWNLCKGGNTMFNVATLKPVAEAGWCGRGEDGDQLHTLLGAVQLPQQRVL